MRVDLHVHTTASDGVLAPSDVVRAAIAAGVDVIAITDHDTIAGIDEALAASSESALRVVPGVELSVEEAASSDVHLLGFMIDHTDAELVATLSGLREARAVRARSMVEALAEAGYSIDYGTVAALAGAGSIGRVHVARALVAAGSVDTVEDAFRLLIGAGAPFHVRKQTLAGARAIAAIHGAGGVAVLAHPGVSGEAALTSLVDAGLDGIEAFHAEHTARQRQHFASLAARLGLLVTGGSDFHGPDTRSAPIGGGACPEDAVDALRARAERYRA